MADQEKTERGSLEERFLEFLSSLRGVESIDDDFTKIELGCGPRADFLLDERRIILEVKTLKVDPKYKVEKRLNKYRARDDFPLFFGTQDIQGVLKHLHDGEAINEEIFHAITRSIQAGVEKANRQIGSTMVSLGLPGACGVVAMLNEEVGAFPPDVIAFVIQRVLKKKKDGRARYQNISYALILDECHITRIGDQTKANSFILMGGPSGSRFPDTMKYLRALQLKWSKAQGVPLHLIQDPEKFFELLFERQADVISGENKGTVSRSSQWRKNYQEHRYLGSLSEEAFFQHMGMLFDSLIPNFLVDGDKMTEAKLRKLIEGWTHALEEANLRGCDMKKFRQYSQLMDRQSP